MLSIWSLHGFHLINFPLFAFLFNVLCLITCILILTFFYSVFVLLLYCRVCLSQTIKHPLLVVLPCIFLSLLRVDIY